MLYLQLLNVCKRFTRHSIYALPIVYIVFVITWCACYIKEISSCFVFWRNLRLYGKSNKVIVNKFNVIIYMDG